MRFLDYWVGILFCFLLSGVEGICKAARISRKQAGPPKSIVFIKLSELGAIILSYPLLRYVKNNYPDAEYFFVTFKKNKEVFALLGGIIPEENILAIRDDSLRLFIFDALKLIFRLRKERTGIIFDLDFFSRFSAILSYLSGAEKRAGFYRYAFEGLYRGNFLTHKAQYNPLKHISRNYLSLGKIIAQEKQDSPELNEDIRDEETLFPRRVPEPGEREKIRKRLAVYGVDNQSRIFIINPGEGILPLREWPLENFIWLSRWIIEDPASYLIIAGTSGVDKKAKAILRAINHPRCINLSGRTSLRELTELFFAGDILISNDCGLAHLAMLTPIMEFIIFGPESPDVFAPLRDNIHIIYSRWPCSPCLSAFNHRKSACRDNKCLKVIRPQDVWEAIKAYGTGFHS